LGNPELARLLVQYATIDPPSNTGSATFDLDLQENEEDGELTTTTITTGVSVLPIGEMAGGLSAVAQKLPQVGLSGMGIGGGDISVVTFSEKWAEAAEEVGVANSAGTPYPRVLNPGTGEPIPEPPAGLKRVLAANRAPWGAQERGNYITEWYDRELATPKGGWANYDIHHIIPREYGGTNAFENLVPVEREVHQNQFNTWWMAY
jgi:hypothetical protein